MNHELTILTHRVNCWLHHIHCELRLPGSDFLMDSREFGTCFHTNQTNWHLKLKNKPDIIWTCSVSQQPPFCLNHTHHMLRFMMTSMISHRSGTWVWLLARQIQNRRLSPWQTLTRSGQVRERNTHTHTHTPLYLFHIPGKATFWKCPQTE